MFLISGQICQTHHQFFGKQVMFSCITEYLHPEWCKAVKQRYILTDHLPCFYIKKRTCTTFFIKLFHHEQYFRRSSAICTVQLEQQPQKLEAVFFLSEKVLQFPDCLATVFINPCYCTEIQIDSRCFQLVSGKLLTMEILEDFFCHIIFSVKVGHISFQELIFRILAACFPQLIQLITGIFFPGLKIRPAFLVFQIIPHQCKFMSLFFSVYINVDT